MPDQNKNAANEGDVMKHPPLQRVVDRLSNTNGKFWYVETHSGYPYYFLPPQGRWTGGIKHLVNQPTPTPAPELLQDYHPVAYHDKQSVPIGFPDKRTYLGSAAQVFQVLKKRGKRIRMTLFETAAEPADELQRYFATQGANTLLIRTGENVVSVGKFLCTWWVAADQAAGNEDVVMVVQGDSYRLARSLWENVGSNKKPDLVFVDPFKLNDPVGQPHGILDSLHMSEVPFMCWTPLNGKTTNWSRSADWTFLQGGVQNAYDFVQSRHWNKFTWAWFSWRGTTSQGMYGCQLTFDRVFDSQFTPASTWTFNGQPGQLPYLDINNQFTQSIQPASNFQNRSTSWQTPGLALNQNAQQIQSQNQPGALWWNKYHAAFWWP